MSKFSTVLFLILSFTGLAHSKAQSLPNTKCDAVFADSIAIPLKGISENLKAGRWQEAAWLAAELGDSNSAFEIRARIRQELLTGEIKGRSKLVGGSSEGYVLEFASGIRGVFKPALEHWTITPQEFHSARMAEHEVAASVVDDLYGFGLVPVTVMRTINRVRGSLQIWVTKENTYTNPAEGARLTTFDYLIRNFDRRANNLLHWRHRLVAIDNALSFSGNFPRYIKAAPDWRDLKAALTALARSGQQMNPLKSVDPETVEAALSTLLTPEEIQAFLRRDEYLRQIGVFGQATAAN